jgi:Spy/CpxP family protein refolding chaperone
VIILRSVLCCALVLFAGAASCHAQSPYVGQELRDIKALSPQEVSDYLSGKGMGLAKAAELNGYPGPAHVLELAVQLELTVEQRAKTEALFQKMQSSAVTLGKALVEEEGALDHLFASGSVDAASLASSLARLGRLQGQLRQVHLEAHLEQTALLTPQQVATYIQLRGYVASSGHGRHGDRHH